MLNLFGFHISTQYTSILYVHILLFFFHPNHYSNDFFLPFFVLVGSTFSTALLTASTMSILSLPAREKKTLAPLYAYIVSVISFILQSCVEKNNLFSIHISLKTLCRSANSSSQRRLLAVIYMHNIIITVPIQGGLNYSTKYWNWLFSSYPYAGASYFLASRWNSRRRKKMINVFSFLLVQFTLHSICTPKAPLCT